MNKKELIDTVLERVASPELARRDAELLLNTLLDVIKERVAQGDEVTLKDFGTFTLLHRQARRGVNPATGLEMVIEGRTQPKFRPGKGWLEMVGENHQAS
jgi:nucleoid DNA-binding protein